MQLRVKNALRYHLNYICCILVFVIVNCLLVVGLSCIDSNHCLRPRCLKFKLKSAYMAFIQDNCVKN